MLQTISVQPIYRWLITLSFLASVIVLSITPGKNQVGDSVFVWLVVNTPSVLQKCLHVACYAILAALFFWALAAVKSQLLRVLLVFVVVVSLGMILEFLQTRIPGRFGTLLDVLLNIFGTLIGIASALLLL
jgi:hypothetical protein